MEKNTNMHTELTSLASFMHIQVDQLERSTVAYWWPTIVGSACYDMHPGCSLFLPTGAVLLSEIERPDDTAASHTTCPYIHIAPSKTPL